jgi:hypothetical protein
MLSGHVPLVCSMLKGKLLVFFKKLVHHSGAIIYCIGHDTLTKATALPV